MRFPFAAAMRLADAAKRFGEAAFYG